MVVLPNLKQQLKVWVQKWHADSFRPTHFEVRPPWVRPAASAAAPPAAAPPYRHSCDYSAQRRPFRQGHGPTHAGQAGTGGLTAASTGHCGGADWAAWPVFLGCKPPPLPSPLCMCGSWGGRRRTGGRALVDAFMCMLRLSITAAAPTRGKCMGRHARAFPEPGPPAVATHTHARVAAHAFAHRSLPSAAAL